jgi:transposase-like protein
VIRRANYTISNTESGGSIVDKLEKRKAWERLIADRAKSNLRVSEWCKKHRVTERQLEYWRKRLRELASQVSAGLNESRSAPAEGTALCPPKDESPAEIEWTPVQIVPESQYEGRSADIYNGKIAVCIGAARIEVGRGFDPALLGDVLKVVASSLGQCAGSGAC